MRNKELELMRNEDLLFLPALNVIVINEATMDYQAICMNAKGFLPEFMSPMHISDTNRVGHALLVRWAEPHPHNSFESVTVMAALIVGLSQVRDLLPKQDSLFVRQPHIKVHKCRNFFPIKGLYL